MNSEKYKVTIITPSYNSNRFIKNTIESVLKQTYTEWEMLIVDDCSSDNSVEIINEFVTIDSRIKLIINTENKGAAESRNVAIRQATGRFIAFLDSDDLWYPNKLEKHLEFMLRNDYEFTFSAYDLITESGDALNKVINVPPRISYNGYLRNTIIGCLTVVIDRDKVGYFEMPLIRSSHDMALWLLILKRGFKAYGLSECLATYRLVSNSNSAKKVKAAKDVWKVYREFEHLSIIKSAFCFLGYAVNGVLKRI